MADEEKSTKHFLKQHNANIKCHFQKSQVSKISLP